MTALVHSLLLRRKKSYPTAGLLGVAALASASFGAAKP